MNAEFGLRIAEWRTGAWSYPCYRCNPWFNSGLLTTDGNQAIADCGLRIAEWRTGVWSDLCPSVFICGLFPGFLTTDYTNSTDKNQTSSDFITGFWSHPYNPCTPWLKFSFPVRPMPLFSTSYD